MNGKPEEEVTKMSAMAEHRKTAKDGKSSAKAAAWFVLVTMGGTSVTLNIWDATHSTHPLYGLIAFLRGLAPVLAALGISEAGARFNGGKVFQRVAFGIMVGAMFLSASAIASVLRPSYPAGILGTIMSWLFGLVLDAAALAGLWIILTERERRRDAERQEAEHDAGRELAEAVAAAEARLRDEADAESEQLQAAHSAELERLRTELTAANATAGALRERIAASRKSRRGSGRKSGGTSAQGRPGSSARSETGTSGPEPASVAAGSSGPEGEMDLDTEARILALIEQGKSPTDARILALIAGGHSASEAGVLAGKSDGYGRQVARLNRAARQEPAGDQRTEGDME
jgi:hypothetical protein